MDSRGDLRSLYERANAIRNGSDKDPNAVEKKMMADRAAAAHEQDLQQRIEKVRKLISGLSESDRDRVLRDAVKPEGSA